MGPIGEPATERSKPAGMAETYTDREPLSIGAAVASRDPFRAKKLQQRWHVSASTKDGDDMLLLGSGGRGPSRSGGDEVRPGAAAYVHEGEIIELRPEEEKGGWVWVSCGEFNNEYHFTIFSSHQPIISYTAPVVKPTIVTALCTYILLININVYTPTCHIFLSWSKRIHW
ncbi:hypothetical protein PIB30_063281 [Stylosanthes scabra]|uniref:SH3 domain-containing protein n=1 Tax=Stylosanthes scabra TaxID=79078 RepID=A0ABU6WLD0_9FABA|nr:hypothetical protein [Stylosanthes scabra]